VPITHSRRVTWHYMVKVKGEVKVVCKNFFLTLFGIKSKRVFSLQNKVLAGSALVSRRGKHDNRPHKINPEVWIVLRQFVECIPHKESHHSTRTSRKYFENPDLNLSKLYESFLDHYNAVSGEELKLAFSTFERYYNRHFEFSFRLPRTDICNVCFKKLQQVTLSTDEEIAYKLHKRKADSYQSLKKKIH
jgi:hypothetical protein